MDTIPHRELRNNSSAVLHSVAAGRSVGVTNNGKLMAVLMPPPKTRLEELAASGRLRPARERIDVRTLPKVNLDQPVADVLDDLKGER